MKTIHYFVDESGDLNLFDKKARPLFFGGNGVSKHFMVGVVKIHDLNIVTQKLEDLRQDLLKDPTLKNVPSMLKTKNFFHAKDDFQAVRREVFNLISTLNLEAQIAVRRKNILLNQAIMYYEKTGKKISSGMVYDDLVKRLFKRLLHLSDKKIITFAERGKSYSNKSLNEALNKARLNFEKEHKLIKFTPPNHHAICAHPRDYSGLQIIDYLLWALFRMYERNDDYYFNKVADKYKLIMDIDDKRNKKYYGEWYTAKSLITLEKIRGAS